MFKNLLSLLIPETCYGCDRALTGQERHICLHCLSQMERTRFEEKPKENQLYFRFAGKIPLNGATGLFYFSKEGRLQEVLHSLKYKNAPHLGVTLGTHLGAAIQAQPWGAQLDAVIPVPLHPSKQRNRGYNQAAQIAQGVADALGIPARTEVLARVRKTETQANKNVFSRWQNVSEAFEAQAAPPRSLLLVDDVITTGATIEACAKALLAHPDPPTNLYIACIGVVKGQ